jgi:general secretion pathway protein K
MNVRSPAHRSPRRGSVLIIVMITLLFATFALLAFMEKASVDLLVDQRDVVTRRLRTEAYSALEMTLGVLNEFREVGNGLRSTAEGWGDPLAFAGYTPSDDRVVEVSFEDESGKISLPHASAPVLTALFKNWELSQSDAETLTDALLGWMKRGHIYTSAIQPNYDSGPLPFEAPGRPVRSWEELVAIEKVRTTFYDADGRPNDLWKRFVDVVSLLDFPKTNLNNAKPDALAALGQFDETQQRNLGEYLQGTGAYQRQGPQFFQNATDAQRIAGPTGDTGAFAATISALRINVTVRDGRNELRVSCVVAPPGGATTVTAKATHAQTTGAALTAAQQPNRPNSVQPAPPGTTGAGQSNAPSLKYPFTLLEIRENDEIPPPPPPRPNPLS